MFFETRTFFFFDFFDLEDFLCHLHNEILDSE